MLRQCAIAKLGSRRLATAAAAATLKSRDVVIVGAGPAGLTLAAALSVSLRVYG